MLLPPRQRLTAWASKSPSFDVTVSMQWKYYPALPIMYWRQFSLQWTDFATPLSWMGKRDNHSFIQSMK